MCGDCLPNVRVQAYSAQAITGGLGTWQDQGWLFFGWLAGWLAIASASASAEGFPGSDKIGENALAHLRAAPVSEKVEIDITFSTQPYGMPFHRAGLDDDPQALARARESVLAGAGIAPREVTFDASDIGVMSVMPAEQKLIGGWFTFTPAGGATAASQEWYTIDNGEPGSGRPPGTAWNGTSNSASFGIYATSGGRFNQATPVPTTSLVGSGSIQFTTRNSATLNYSFSGGGSGSIPLTRLGPAPGPC